MCVALEKYSDEILDVFAQFYNMNNRQQAHKLIIWLSFLKDAFYDDIMPQFELNRQLRMAGYSLFNNVHTIDRRLTDEFRS
jgi:hypothetical protein